MLSIGELAVRTGTTARALRLYERHGLIVPDRTPAGRRFYDVSHVTVLAQIRTLKDMGLTLASIARLMRARTLDARELVALRLDQVEAERARLSEVAAQLRAAQAALASGPVDAAALADLLAERRTGGFQNLLDRWFGSDEQKQWRDVLSMLDTAAWPALKDRIQAAINTGVAPHSRKGQLLAREWLAAMTPVMTSMGTERWNRAATMFKNEAGSGEQDTPRDDVALYRWLFEAVPAALSQPLHAAGEIRLYRPDSVRCEGEAYGG